MIGQMRHLVTIQSERRTTDTDGSAALLWYDDVQVYAEIKPRSGSESFHGMQIEGRVTHEITIRYRTDVTPKKRVYWNNRAFNIRAILNVNERDRWLKLAAEEGVAT
jgi:SPP1 family predicted phage head-tail adaptor